MPREDLILFLDLETTGSDEDQGDEIIEVGIVALDATQEGYPEIGHFQQVIVPTETAYNRLVGKDVVRTMHEKNGLLADIDTLRESGRYDLPTIRSVDLEAVIWLNMKTKGDTTHIPYGGSGVSHFDRPFIKKYMPTFDKRITHWSYDVGVLRRSWRKAGMPTYKNDAFTKNHRALDDARVHAEEWRYYQRYIRG